VGFVYGERTPDDWRNMSAGNVASYFVTKVYRQDRHLAAGHSVLLHAARGAVGRLGRLPLVVVYDVFQGRERVIRRRDDSIDPRAAGSP